MKQLLADLTTCLYTLGLEPKTILLLGDEELMDETRLMQLSDDHIKRIGDNISIGQLEILRVHRMDIRKFVNAVVVVFVLLLLVFPLCISCLLYVSIIQAFLFTIWSCVTVFLCSLPTRLFLCVPLVFCFVYLLDFICQRICLSLSACGNILSFVAADLQMHITSPPPSVDNSELEVFF